MYTRDWRREPRYSIGVTSQLVGLHPQTLRHYENLGLVVPRRTPGNHRLYSDHDVERLRLISRLTADLGVNLAGVEVVLNMTEQVNDLREKARRREEELLDEIAHLRRLVAMDGWARMLPGRSAGDGDQSGRERPW